MGEMKKMNYDIKDFENRAIIHNITLALCYLAITLLIITIAYLHADRDRIIAEYKKANNTASYWIQQYNMLEKDYVQVVEGNYELKKIIEEREE